MSLDSLPIPTLASFRGYSCVWTMVDDRKYSVLTTRFNTCLTYFKVACKITRDFETQCWLFTYTCYEYCLHTQSMLILQGH